MTPAKKFSAEEIRHWFNYNPDTGEFHWRNRPPRAKINVGALAGSMATHRGKPRRVLHVMGRKCYGSRAAWLHVHGDLPAEALIDHIDGDTTNDRIANLRLAGHAQNAWNRIRPSAAGLLPGVSKGERGRYKARIQLPGGAKLNLGTWETEREAHAAYLGAAAVLRGEFNPDHLAQARAAMERKR